MKKGEKAPIGTIVVNGIVPAVKRVKKTGSEEVILAVLGHNKAHVMLEMIRNVTDGVLTKPSSKQNMNL